MNLNLIRDFQNLFLKDKSFRWFIVATILGLSFSLSIVLSTLGLMDGFSRKLKESLNEGNGEIIIFSQKGFFNRDNEDFSKLDEIGVKKIAYSVRTQSFLSKSGKGRAVLVYGIDNDYNEIAQIEIPTGHDLVIGEKLASDMGLRLGDEVSLTFAAGRSGDSFLPTVQLFKIKEIHKFKIHYLNDRYVFANLGVIQKNLGVDFKVNIANLKLEDHLLSISSIEDLVLKLRSMYYWDYQILPYWGEFASFLKAVDFEKYLISLVLYIVVIIASFNCLAFIVFSKERKAKEIFLLYAIGFSPKKFKQMWYLQNIVIWLLAFGLSFVLVFIFDYAIQNFSMFALPMEVYSLGRIAVDLSLKSILFTAVTSFLLIMFLTFLTLKKISSKSLIQGLREEFS